MPAGQPVPELPVVLVGAHGHGRTHLANLERLAAAGSPLRLAGICDPQPATPDLRPRVAGVPWADDLAALIDRVGARVAIVCTPIHTHRDLAVLAAERGCDVLLEKPPAPTLAVFTDLAGQFARLGRACQVGFQDLASPAIGQVRALIGQGAIGELRGIGAAGTWVRETSYFGRSSWAGRRTLAGRPVMDGVLSNPFAHAVASALVLDGSEGMVPPSGIEVELYRANAIESDDTSCVRLRTERGTTVVVAATLSAAQNRDPVISVHGSRGRIDLLYKQGTVLLHQDGRPGAPPSEPVRRWEFTRPDLLEDLGAHVLDRGRPLRVPLPRTTAFMHVLEALRTAPDPLPVPDRYRREVPTPTGARVEIPGVDDTVAQAAERLALFSELSPDWLPRAAARR